MSEDSQLLKPIRKVRVSDTVVDQIISLIENGSLKMGDQLPTERELVSQWQVARASVREALRILEYSGVIEVRPGKGAFIVGDISNLEGEEGVRRWFQEHASTVIGMLEVRQALESRASRLAAERASPEQIADIASVIEEAESCIVENDLDQLIYLDRKFHRCLAQASQNQLFSQLIDMVTDAMVSPRRSIMRLPGRARKSWDDHQVILNAIKEGNPDKAEEAVAAHMRRVHDAIVALSKNDSENGEEE
jgi:GntR family transcriptional repressor for pyruvate dehydrogenase complex